MNHLVIDLTNLKPRAHIRRSKLEMVNSTIEGTLLY